jgi:hypothetical protein
MFISICISTCVSISISCPSPCPFHCPCQCQCWCWFWWECRWYLINHEYQWYIGIWIYCMWNMLWNK